MKASIIIPVKEINDYLRKETVPAILKQTVQDFEIIILPDQKSKERFPKTRIIPTYPQTGPADKRDIGAKSARGEVLAFLDDDSYPEKNWLEKALDVFKENKESVGVCGPAVTPPQDSVWQKASGYVWSTWLGCGGAGICRSTAVPRMEVDDFPSVNLLVLSKAFGRVGGFDSHFWPGEDTKLCHDLVYKLHKKIVYDPTVLVYHHRRKVFKPHLQQISRYAVHRGHFARVLPKTSFRVGYLVPTLFSLGLLGGVLASFVNPILKGIYLSVVCLYLLALLLTSLTVSLKERNVLLGVLLVPTIFVTHFIYGLLFLKGFLSPNLKR